MFYSYRYARAGGEMVDTLALGASAVRHGGSSPLPPTLLKKHLPNKCFFNIYIRLTFLWFYD